MPTFDTLSQLTNYVKKTTLREVAGKVSEIGEKVVNDRVEQNLYARVSSGDFYENTFGLRNASESFITNRNDNMGGKSGLETNIFINPVGDYPADTGGYDGQSQSEFIVSWLENGHKGFYKNVAINYEGRDIFKDSHKDLIKGGFLKKSISDYLKSIGYVISRASNVGK